MSTYPVLIEELLSRDWNEEELQGVLRGNLLRVFRQVEQVDTLGRTRVAGEAEGSGEAVGAASPPTAASRSARRARGKGPWRTSSQMSSWAAFAAPSSRGCIRDIIWLQTRS